MQTDAGTSVLHLMRCSDLRTLRRHLLDEIRDLWKRDPLAPSRLALIFASSQSAQLMRLSIEEAALADGLTAFVLPRLLTASQFWSDRYGTGQRADPILREALLAQALRQMTACGLDLPFRLHQGMHREILALADEMADNTVSLDEFERACTESFGGAVDDPGAERMEKLSRCIITALRMLDQSLAALGLADPAAIRSGVAGTTFECIHVMDSLARADIMAFARLRGVSRVTIWVTERECAAGLLASYQEALPRLQISDVAGPRSRPRSLDAGDASCRLWRDREEDLVRTAILIKQLHREGEIEELEKVAVVFSRPLPYVYLAKRAFGAAGVPYQVADTYPLSIEPWAGAIDLVLQFVSAGFRRDDGIALLRSPFFSFSAESPRERRAATVALALRMSQARFVAGVDGWSGTGLDSEAMADLAAESSVASKARTLLRMIQRYGCKEEEDRVGAAPEVGPIPGSRGRAAVVSILAAIERAYLQAGADEPISCGAFRSIVRRWIDQHTFAPRLGEAGVHLLQLDAARHGDFTHIFVVGLIADEWPWKPSRHILYPQTFLASLGWPAEAFAAAIQRARFLDLVESAASAVGLSAFTLEEDTPVSRSPFVEMAEGHLERAPDTPARIDLHVVDGATALGLNLVPPVSDGLWQELRSRRDRIVQSSFAGQVGFQDAGRLAVGDIDRHLRCPFLTFVRMAHLRDEGEDEEELSLPARGLLLHGVLRDFYQEWDGGSPRGRPRPVRVQDWPDFRASFLQVLHEHLRRIPATERAVERRRYEGSPLQRGVIEKLFRAELMRKQELVTRRLEMPFADEFDLRSDAAELRVSLSGRMDRVDVDAGGRALVIDYKLGKRPDPKRSAQLSLYAACLPQLASLEGLPEGMTCESRYYAFGEDQVESRRARTKDDGEILQRAIGAIQAIREGRLAPEPRPEICAWCAFPSLCRKESSSS